MITYSSVEGMLAGWPLEGDIPLGDISLFFWGVGNVVRGQSLGHRGRSALLNQVVSIY